MKIPQKGSFVYFMFRFVEEENRGELLEKVYNLVVIN